MRLSRMRLTSRLYRLDLLTDGDTIAAMKVGDPLNTGDAVLERERIGQDLAAGIRELTLVPPMGVARLTMFSERV